MITLKYCREIKTVVKNTAEYLRKHSVPNSYRIISNRHWLFWFDSQRLSFERKISQHLLLTIYWILFWSNSTIFSLKERDKIFLYHIFFYRNRTVLSQPRQNLTVYFNYTLQALWPELSTAQFHCYCCTKYPSEVCRAWSLPCHRRQCWSCSGRPCPRSAGRWISARGCSRSRAPGSCRWCRCSAGTRPRSATPARGTTSASPSCSPGWCNCWGPSPARSWSEPHTTPHCDCSPAHGAFHLGGRENGFM